MRRMRLLAAALLLAGTTAATAGPTQADTVNADGTLEIYDPTDGGWYNRVPPHLAEAVRALIVAKQTRSDTLPRIAPTSIPVGCPTCAGGTCPTGTCPSARPWPVIMPSVAPVGGCPGGNCPAPGYRVR